MTKRTQLEADLDEYWKRYLKNPTSAREADIEGNESSFARMLSAVLAVDASVLAEAPTKPGLAEHIAVAVRVRAAWAAYHGVDDLVGRKQRALVAALHHVTTELKSEPDDHRSSVLRAQLRHVDRVGSETIPTEAIEAALAAWPPHRGAPKKAERSGKSAWGRVNSLFVAFGCGYADDGEALRVHLSDTGIYRAKKA